MGRWRDSPSPQWIPASSFPWEGGQHISKLFSLRWEELATPPSEGDIVFRRIRLSPAQFPHDRSVTKGHCKFVTSPLLFIHTVHEVLKARMLK